MTVYTPGTTAEDKLVTPSGKSKDIAGGRSTDVDLAQDGQPGTEPISTLKEDAFSQEEALLKQFAERVHEGYRYWKYTYDDAVTDLEFGFEQQWASKDINERADRPCLTLNMIPQFMNHMIGQARQSKFSIAIKSKGGVNSRVPVVGTGGEQTLSYAEIMSGIIRDIEQRCKAPVEYAQALQHAVEGGFGWLQADIIRPQDDPLNTEIKVSHVANRWSVMFDPTAEDFCLRDAKWACKSVVMSVNEFRARYPDKPAPTAPGDWDTRNHDFQRWWGDGDVVRVADYYYKQPMKRTIKKYIHKETREDVWGYDDELDIYEDELKDAGYELIGKPVEMTVDCLMLMRCTNNMILEPPSIYPSTMIPIVPVFGRKIDLAQSRKYLSLTRYVMDAQRMFNYWASAATERVGNSPKAPWLVTDKHIAGYEDQWKNSNIGNRAVLVYNHIEGDTPPPVRQDPADMATAELQMLGLAKQTMQDIIGIHEAERGIRSNETSGTAIQRRQQAGAVSTYEFIDNLAHSIGVLGDVLCQMVPKVYVGDRLQNLVLPDDSEAQVHLNHMIKDEESGKEFNIGTLQLSRYHCLSNAGPMLGTEREKFVEMMLEWGKANPEILAMGIDKMFENIDSPGAKQMAARLKKTIPRHLLTPQEQENIPETPPSPEQEAEQAKAQASMAESQAKMAMAESMLQVESAKAEAMITKAHADKQIAQIKLQEARASSAHDAGVNSNDVQKQVDETLSKERVKAGLQEKVPAQ